MKNGHREGGCCLGRWIRVMDRQGRGVVRFIVYIGRVLEGMQMWRIHVDSMEWRRAGIGIRHDRYYIPTDQTIPPISP